MLLFVAAISVALSAPQGAQAAQKDEKPVSLNHVFSKGEKLEYSILSSLHVEMREYGLQTFIPDDMDLNYKFTTEVRDLKADGVAVLHYLRPNMVQVDAATFDKPSKTTVEKINMNYDLTISPINAILDEKDLNPPKKKPAKTGDGGGDGSGLRLFGTHVANRQNPLQAFMGQFVSEVYRLALNVGSMDSALDFSPKLPLDDVKVGDTWKSTVGYQPQKLQGKNGKQAVQRLDYTFTYKGIVTVNGKPYYRVNAALSLNTDLGAFINQLMDAKPEETHLKSAPLTLKQSIDYDLDMATKRTISARSKAEGAFSVNLTDTEEPVEEQKLSGSTEMRLIGVGVATAPKAGTGHAGQSRGH
ncbi:MAG: hypothetical protein ACHQ50_01880 [Fimbriimonadales bacterium]